MKKPGIRLSLTIARGLFALAASISSVAQAQGFVARYTATGDLDTTFDRDGSFVTADLSVKYTSVLWQGNGRITTGGSFVVNGASRQLITRCDDAGNADLGFGLLGAASIDVPGVTRERVSALAFGRNLKVLAVVEGDGTLDKGWLIERLNANGSLDTSFGFGGFAGVSFGDVSLSVAHGMATYQAPSPPPQDLITIAAVGTVQKFTDPLQGDIVVSIHDETAPATSSSASM